jgi:hypothetical protein
MADLLEYAQKQESAAKSREEREMALWVKSDEFREMAKWQASPEGQRIQAQRMREQGEADKH